MNILIANDDGIKAPGIHALARALDEELGADVYVVAPDGQRSAASHSISLHGKVALWPEEFEHARKAFAISGTPADCVSIGVKHLEDMGIKTDLVFSGINNGSNVGTDTLYSGTIGAAKEGSVQGIPSAAVSVDSDFMDENAFPHFDYACMLAVDTVRKTGGSWDPAVIININTPNLPADMIKGVQYTSVGEREYSNDIQLVETEGEKSMYIYAGEVVRYDGNPETFDVLALQHGYASITPLQLDTTAVQAKADLLKWRIGK